MVKAYSSSFAAWPRFWRVQMQKIVLHIEGMTCGGCVKSVSNILQGLDGVQSAEVSLEQKQAAVAYDAAQITPEAMIAAIEDGGFEAHAE